MKNVQQGAKSLAKMLGWLLVWSVIGYLLLVLAYSLPVGRMKDHLRSEESTFTDGYYMLVRNDTSWPKRSTMDQRTHGRKLPQHFMPAHRKTRNTAKAICASRQQ